MQCQSSFKNCLKNLLNSTYLFSRLCDTFLVKSSPFSFIRSTRAKCNYMQWQCCGTLLNTRSVKVRVKLLQKNCFDQTIFSWNRRT